VALRLSSTGIMWRLRATSILSLLNGAHAPCSSGKCSSPWPASAPRLPLGLLSSSHVVADQAAGIVTLVSAPWLLRATAKHSGTSGGGTRS